MNKNEAVGLIVLIVGTWSIALFGSNWLFRNSYNPGIINNDQRGNKIEILEKSLEITQADLSECNDIVQENIDKFNEYVSRTENSMTTMNNLHSEIDRLKSLNESLREANRSFEAQNNDIRNAYEQVLEQNNTLRNYYENPQNNQ